MKLCEQYNQRHNEAELSKSNVEYDYYALHVLEEVKRLFGILPNYMFEGSLKIIISCNYLSNGYYDNIVKDIDIFVVDSNTKGVKKSKYFTNVEFNQGTKAIDYKGLMKSIMNYMEIEGAKIIFNEAWEIIVVFE